MIFYLLLKEIRLNPLTVYLRGHSHTNLLQKRSKFVTTDQLQPDNRVHTLSPIVSKR
jgi:hypothetical protein